MLTVTQALAQVMADIPAIGKGDKSNEGYSYRGIEAITRHLQPILARHGVIIVPDATTTNIVPSPFMNDGWQDVHVTVGWTIFGPDGSHITARTSGIGRDKADKGANKAQTQAYKYLLLHLLCIADRADDADGQSYEHDRSDTVHAPSPIMALFERLREVAGTPVADRLKLASVESGLALTTAALAANGGWAEQVKAILDGAQVTA